jgi:hypothetical protein
MDKKDIELLRNEILDTLARNMQRINESFEAYEELLKSQNDRLGSHDQILAHLRQNAMQNEYYWKAYTDVDKMHEDRLDNHEKRIGKLELRVS